jgi:SAM-dependent methyltransferase
MTGYDPARYGNVVGDNYDELYPGDPGETSATADALARLARERDPHTLLELGIGTGRVALAVQELGIQVAGIDGSESMIAQLRAKPEAADVQVELGDYRDTRIEGTFATVALLYNGILDPRGPDAQLDIFRNAARHLAPAGRFVVESLVLSDEHRAGGWWTTPRYVGSEHVELQFARYDITTNRIERTLVHLRPAGLQFLTVTDIYASPAELDLMATVTGFTLLHRHAGWHGEDYTAHSSRHVSVYELAPAHPLHPS